MKINFLIPSLVAVMIFALAGVPVNAKKSSSSSPSAPSTPNATGPTTFHGTIIHLDVGAKSLTVKIDAKSIDSVELVLAVTANTQGGNSLSTMAVGDKVGGTYTTDPTGTLTATELKKEKGGKKGKGGKSGK